MLHSNCCKSRIWIPHFGLGYALNTNAEYVNLELFRLTSQVYHHLKENATV